jgi:hypothetical protein
MINTQMLVLNKVGNTIYIYIFGQESNSKELSNQGATNIVHVLSMSIKMDVGEKGVL